MNRYPYIELDYIHINRKVVELLPPEIAYRYHALPVASDGNQVTIAISSPEDQNACRVVKSIIEAPVFWIRADLDEIDCLLHELWPQETARLKILFWSSQENSNQAYIITKGIARPLGAELERIKCQGNGRGLVSDLVRCLEDSAPDLFVLQTDHAFRLIKKLASTIRSSDLPDFLILSANPTLPLNNLLFIAGGQISCSGGVSWALRLSQLDHINVSMLPVLPPTPPCYGSLLHHDLAAIKSGNNLLGKDLRSQAGRLREQGIKVTCMIREGDSYDQIRDEIRLKDPDLIVVPAIYPKGKVEWADIDTLSIIYKHISKPILITH